MSDEFIEDNADIEAEINEEDDALNVEDTEEESQEETPDVADLQEKNKKLFNRAKTAETELKTLKAKLAEKDKPVEAPQPTNDSLSREEAILIAQGMDEQDLDELKDIAKAKGLPLLKAKDTPIFQAYLDAREAEKKKEKARLSTSKGSQVTEQVDIASLDPDAHKALVKEVMSKVK